MNFIIPKTAESMKGEIFACFRLYLLCGGWLRIAHRTAGLGTLSDDRLHFAEEYTSIPRMRYIVCREQRTCDV